MDKAKCDSDKHIWVCEKESGFLNEITTFRPLAPIEIANLKQDTRDEKKICAKGAIVCSRCGEYLNKNHQPKIDLAQKLKSLKIKSLR